jgi:hypothetical protein
MNRPTLVDHERFQDSNVEFVMDKLKLEQILFQVSWSLLVRVIFIQLPTTVYNVSD